MRRKKKAYVIGIAKRINKNKTLPVITGTGLSTLRDIQNETVMHRTVATILLGCVLRCFNLDAVYCGSIQLNALLKAVRALVKVLLVS